MSASKAILKVQTKKLRKVFIMSGYAESQKELIGLVAEKLEVESNYMVSKCTGISESTISRACRNETFFNDYFIFYLCNEAKIDASKTLAHIRETEAKAKGKEKEEEFWHKLNIA